MSFEYIYVSTHGQLIPSKYFTLDSKTTLIQPACCGNVAFSTDVPELLEQIRTKLHYDKLNTIIHSDDTAYLVNTNTTLCDIYLTFLNPLDLFIPLFIGTFDVAEKGEEERRTTFLPFEHDNNDEAFEKFYSLINKFTPLIDRDVDHDLLQYKINQNNLGYDNYYEITANLFGNFIQNLLMDLFFKSISNNYSKNDLSYIVISQTNSVKFDISKFPCDRLFSSSKPSFLPINANMVHNLYLVYYDAFDDIFKNKRLLSEIIKHAGLPKNNNNKYEIRMPIIINNIVTFISIKLNKISIPNDAEYQDDTDLTSAYANSFYDLSSLKTSDKGHVVNNTIITNSLFYRLSYAYLLYCNINRFSYNEFKIWDNLILSDRGYCLLSNLIDSINSVYKNTRNVIFVSTCQSVPESGKDHCEIRNCVVKASGLDNELEVTKITKKELLEEINLVKDSGLYDHLFVDPAINIEASEFASDKDNVLILNFILNYYDWTNDKSPFTDRLKACVIYIIELISSYEDKTPDINCLVVNAKFILDELNSINMSSGPSGPSVLDLLNPPDEKDELKSIIDQIQAIHKRDNFRVSFNQDDASISYADPNLD